MPEIADSLSLTDLRNLAVALVIGFLVGFEREWTHVDEAREHSFAGARTFSLIGFIGGLAGILADGQALLIAAFLAVALLTTVAYHAEAREASGVGGTTEMAILATFLLGAAATGDHLLLAAIGGVAVAIVLSIKHSVEEAAAALSEVEVHAALRFLALSIIVLPILPNQGYGPYEAINPREIWLMVIFISGLSFAGYWLMKFLGERHGIFLTGVVGGFASSTATTLSLAKFSREGVAPARAVAAGVIAANVVMLIRVGFILAAISRTVLTAVWPVLASGALVGAAAAFFLWWSVRDESDAKGVVDLGNPMEIKPALIFAALLAVITLASRFGADQFGEGALYLVGLVSGLADVDAMTLTAGRQAEEGAISAISAGGAVMMAVASNIVVKGVMAGSIGGKAVGKMVAAGFAAVILVGAGVYLVLR